MDSDNRVEGPFASLGGVESGFTGAPSADPVASLVPGGSPQALSPALAELRALAEQAAEYSERRVADNTRRYLEADWAQYERWCAQMQVPAEPIDARIVSLYVTDLARQRKRDGTYRYKASSLGRHVSSLSRRHYDMTGESGLGKHQAITAVMSGIRRDRQEPVNRKRPLLLDQLVRVLDEMPMGTWPGGATAIRDRFAILLGFATAMRRSEVSELLNGDLTFEPDRGLHVRVRSSKTDQDGVGATLGVPVGSSPVTCVPCAWLRWGVLARSTTRAQRMSQVLSASEPDEWRSHLCQGPVAVNQANVGQTHPGWADLPLLRPMTKAGEVAERPVTPDALNLMLKRRLEAAGFDSSAYGWHSLRAGFVTQARRNGADSREVRRQTRHSSDAMVDVYDREFEPLLGNAVTKLGL